MPRSWLRDTDIHNRDALFCFIIDCDNRIVYLDRPFLLLPSLQLDITASLFFESPYDKHRISSTVMCLRGL